MQVAGVAGVPANATAASLNLTVAQPAAPGYLTAWPCGQPRPLASNLNHQAGQTVANLVSVGIGSGGRVCIFTAAPAYVVVDVGGWWGPGAGAGFGAVSPVRLTAPGRRGGGQRRDRGGGRGPGRRAARRPSHGAERDDAQLHLRRVGHGLAVRAASTEHHVLNYGAGQTVANLATVSLGTGGKVCLSSSSPATPPRRPQRVVGPGRHRLRPSAVAPRRLLDTRPALVPTRGASCSSPCRPARRWPR